MVAGRFKIYQHGMDTNPDSKPRLHSVGRTIQRELGRASRYRKMSDEKLREMGEAARYMCSPKANMGKPPRECFVKQLQILRELWRERHPKLPLSESV
jgi:hypothetical protein